MRYLFLFFNIQCSELTHATQVMHFTHFLERVEPDQTAPRGAGWSDQLFLPLYLAKEKSYFVVKMRKKSDSMIL